MEVDDKVIQVGVFSSFPYHAKNHWYRTPIVKCLLPSRTAECLEKCKHVNIHVGIEYVMLKLSASLCRLDQRERITELQDIQNAITNASM